jgi:hypothetical protein
MRVKWAVVVSFAASSLAIVSACSSRGQPGAGGDGNGNGDGGRTSDASETGSKVGDASIDSGITVAPGFHLASQTDYPTVDLRGYGPLGGALLVLDGGMGPLSVLLITASDAAHAKLTHAKYLSDLNVISGVTSVELHGVPGWSVPGQGTVVAFVSGSSVLIVAGSVAADVQKQLAAMTEPGRSYDASVAVPMYLDRWDKHGFNFYYAPWWSSDATYDYRTDFEYAKAHGNTGFAIWSGGPLSVPEAEGQMGDGPNTWAIQSAGKRGLAAVWNNSSENNTPTWLLSQYRGSGSLLERMPGFSGNECTNRTSFDQCFTSWAGGAVDDALLGVLQKPVRDYGTEPNVISILEPHGELNKGPFDLFVSYGPQADASLQAFVKGRYASPHALDVAWDGGSGQITSWTDVHAPELSSFLGHDSSSFDLPGPWHVLPGTSAAAGTPAPAWSAPSYDDSGWGQVGNDDSRLFLPTGATAIRTQFEPSAFKPTGSAYLYVFSLGTNCGTGNYLRAFLNGAELTASDKVFPNDGTSPQWTAFQVNSIGSGQQTLALSIPPCTGGYVLGYKTYLSNTAPQIFPGLSATLDQRWVDFIDWYASMRGNSVAKGMGMIRQVDRDKSIELMAPNLFADFDKMNAEDYGGTFHDTGFMSGFWIDELPAQMRSAGRPFSAEDGGPASTAAGFQQNMGHWLTEGVNGATYFQNIAEVTTNAPIEAVYEAWQPMLGMLGKYHGAHTDAAQLFSRRTERMLGFPWHGDANFDINGGATNSWQLGVALEDEYDLDAVTEPDFGRGNAAQYKVIIDGNTSFMDDPTVSDIETWIKAGGTFVTYVQTGRHSPSGANTWPISKLTGYSVVSIDPAIYGQYQLGTVASASTALSSALNEVSGQTLLESGWNGVLATGLHLKKVAPEAQDILTWADGTVAVGVRPLGKGSIVTLGAKFVTDEGWRGDAPSGTKMMKQLLRHAQAVRVPGRAVAYMPGTGVDGGIEAGTDGGAGSVDFSGPDHFRHFVSNNGLFDVWVLQWNGTAAIDVELSVEPQGATAATLPTRAFDVLQGASLPMSNHGTSARLTGIHLEPNDVRMILTARNQVSEAPGAWFELQRTWWLGTKAPRTTPYPAPVHRYTVDLSTKYPMGEEGSAHGWTQSFTVPATWTGGTKELWVTDWRDPVLIDSGSVELDGTTVWGPSSSGAKAIDVTSTLSPGSKHSFAVTTTATTSTVSGVRGEAWVRYLPDPKNTLSLAGTWTPSTNGLLFEGSMTLPGPWAIGTASKTGIAAARRSIDVPASWSGTDVVLAIQSGAGLAEVLVNGHWVHGASGWASTAKVVRINVTSFIVAGAANTIEVFPFAAIGQPSVCSSATCVESLELESFPADGIYP